MATVILRAVPLLLVGYALWVWLRKLRHNKRPDVLAACWAQVFIALALIAQLAYPVIQSAIDVPALAHFLMHAFGLVSAYWLSAFALHLGQHEAVAPRTVRRRAWLLAAALVGLTVFYIIGPVKAGLPKISAESDAPFVAHYVAVFTAYIALALIEVAWMTMFGERSENKWLRRGMLLLGTGAMIGLLYAALRVATPILAAAGIWLPWDNAGPAGVGTYLMLLAGAQMTAGILVPPLAQRWQARTASAEDGAM
jgi:hypothetical protein